MHAWRGKKGGPTTPRTKRDEKHLRKRKKKDRILFSREKKKENLSGPPAKKGAPGPGGKKGSFLRSSGKGREKRGKGGGRMLQNSEETRKSFPRSEEKIEGGVGSSSSRRRKVKRKKRKKKPPGRRKRWGEKSFNICKSFKGRIIYPSEREKEVNYSIIRQKKKKKDLPARGRG